MKIFTEEFMDFIKDSINDIESELKNIRIKSDVEKANKYLKSATLLHCPHDIKDEKINEIIDEFNQQLSELVDKKKRQILIHTYPTQRNCKTGCKKTVGAYGL